MVTPHLPSSHTLIPGALLQDGQVTSVKIQHLDLILTRSLRPFTLTSKKSDGVPG